jgi:Na+/melibiose symporter-like transporter
MKPKTRNTLVAGVALFIFGPVLGWVLTMAGFVKTGQSILQTPSGTIPDMGHAASLWYVSLIPILVGVVCGAVGFFLIVYALITHFFRSNG